MADADKALKLNKQSTKAILAKAEALYNMGQFENALVQFERGWRVRQDPEIRAGIIKCRDVIINTVGTTAKEYDREVVEKVIQEMKDLFTSAAVLAVAVDAAALQEAVATYALRTRRFGGRK